MDYDDEINQLQHEGEIPLEDLLASLPKEILHGRIPDEGVQKVAVENLEVTKVTAVRKKAKDQRKQKRYKDVFTNTHLVYFPSDIRISKVASITTQRATKLC